MDAHSASVTCVSAHPNGRLVASCSKDRTVRLWDVSSGVCVRTLRSHPADITAVNVSDDGTQLLSLARDGGVRVWDLRTGVLKQVCPRAATARVRRR